jgi:protein-tyrosine-phosphatase/DNA-binding HxlR family transcriptional regulator
MPKISKASLEIRARRFAALGDGRRLLIAESLVASHRTPSELIEITGLSSNLLAHHLDILERAGVIQRLDGTSDRRKRFIALVDVARNLLTPPRLDGPVLFVCSQNSARSQLASAIWQAETGGLASSAGTHPADSVHPLALEVAQDHDLDLSDARPKQVTSEALRTSTVITVCDQAHDELPRPLQRFHWSIPDPASAGHKRDFEDTFNKISEIINALKGTSNVV